MLKRAGIPDDGIERLIGTIFGCNHVALDELRRRTLLENNRNSTFSFGSAIYACLSMEYTPMTYTCTPAFKKMMAFVCTGDTVVVESISRIARNTRDLLSIVAELSDRQVDFISLKENIDTTPPQGRFMLTVFGALAELERENSLERQREGIEIAKVEGKYKGRKPLDVDEARLRAVCARWRAGEVTAISAMKELGLKPNTFYRRVKEYEL